MIEYVPRRPGNKARVLVSASHFHTVLEILVSAMRCEKKQKVYRLERSKAAFIPI